MSETGAPGTMRLFIAITLPDSVKSAIQQAQTELRRALPEGCVRWIRRDQLHLTLKFLGNIESERVPQLADAVRTACSGFAALKLRAELVGFFPNARSPRVIWTAVRDSDGQLARVHDELDGVTRDFSSEKPDKEFRGHVTLGRVKNIRRLVAVILAQVGGGMAKRIFGEWTADKVELIRSELTPSGPNYSVEAVAVLSHRSGAIPRPIK
jgi:2'-5' RNA ligase